MKRRQFIRGIGAGSAGITALPVLAGGKPEGESLPPYSYGSIQELKDVLSQEGFIVVRLAIGDDPEEEGRQLSSRIRVRRASVVRSRDYFFEQDEHFNPERMEVESSTLGSDREVVVLWLAGASEESLVEVGGKKGFQFSLKELLRSQEMAGSVGGCKVSANFLLDREMGEVQLEDFGASDPGNRFSFLTMADPQGGNPVDPEDSEKLRTRMKIHNAFIEESVALANRLEFDPLFTMVAGDVCDDWGYAHDLLQMNAFLSRLKCPVLYGIGNHETLLRSSFKPGYNMEAFHNFLAAQKAINGLDKLLYSFNAGRWHFIVWPDPLRSHFWETHPHYFDWLERDLDKHKDRPTMVFQHVPSHPIGITPHINYAESVYVRRTFLDILSKHGNVKYILSGHVHIPLKAAFKTAVQYRGMKMINIPAAGYRPRNFGEEDFYGGPSQGFAMVHVDGEKVQIQYKTVTEEVFDFPEELPELDTESYGLWLKEKWELPARKDFVNGDFRSGLEAWCRRFVYMEDIHPSNICESRTAPGGDGQALYLWCRRRGYQTPGQDRLPQDVNRVVQAVSLDPHARPAIKLKYRIEGENTEEDSFSGGIVRVDGYRGSNLLLKQIYSAGKIWVNNWGARNLNKDVPFRHFELVPETDQWHDALLHIAEDYERTSQGKGFGDLQLDRLVLTLGVWHINDGEEWPFGIYFTGLQLLQKHLGFSTVNGLEIREKDEKDIWWRNKIWPNKNLAGEHRYIIATSIEKYNHETKICHVT